MKAKDILFEFLKDRKWHYLTGIILLIITTVIASLIPSILGIITDILQSGETQGRDVYFYIAALAVITIVVFALKFTWRYFLIGSCRYVECYLRERLFRHLQSLPASFYDNHKTGDLVAYAINDIQAVRMIFGFGSIAILEGALLNGFSIYFMITTINPIFTVIALLPSFILIFVLYRLRAVIREKFTKVQKTFALISERVEENIMGIRVIKSFAQEKQEVEEFVRLSQKRVDTLMDLTKFSGILGPATQFCFGISFLIFIVYGSELVANRTISLGDYVAFNSYMMLIMGPITNIVRIIEVWQRGLASMRRLDDILSVKSDIVDKEIINDFQLNGSIEVRNLSFKYPGSAQFALKDVNFTLPKGKVLGILGRSGSGKTTLVNLLLRLYPIEDGLVFVDGEDINNIPLRILREKIGCVPQENFLFSTTIRENIGFFKSSFTDDEIEQASKMSAVFDNITSFPDGFDTVVGERGITLSGGQKQRISLARAIIKQPAILILDDSLSAVDTKTEEEILMNMTNVLKGLTGIIISHRVSAIRHADTIIYMDNGEIIESGAHDELMLLKRRYFDLYKMQQESEERQDQSA